MKKTIFKDFTDKKDVLKIFENSKYVTEDEFKNKLIHTYRIYFDKAGNPTSFKLYDEEGRCMGVTSWDLDESASSIPATSRGKILYIYRKRNNTDKLEKEVGYNFIVQGSNGKELECKEYQGKKLYKECKQVKGRKVVSYYFGGRACVAKDYYDENDNMIKRESFNKGLYGDWYRVEYQLFYYNKLSKIMKAKRFVLDNFISTTQYKYSKRGNLIGEKHKWSNKNKKGTNARAYLWDEEAGLIQQEFVYANSVLLWEIKYSYDHLKRLVRKDHRSSPDAVLKIWEIYEYDKDNRIVKEEEVSFGGSNTCTTYEYDKRGRKVRETWIMKFPADSTYDKNIRTYRYDNRGRLDEESFEFKHNVPVE
ncbi:MAG: hypothetical protein WC614_13250 [bacterium]